LALSLIILFAGVGYLGSETVSLTTYYPAPSGVYTRIITTADTYLARDGGMVGVGTTAPQVALHVRSAGGTANTDIAVEKGAYKWTMGVVGANGNWILNKDIPGTLPAITVTQAGNVSFGGPIVGNLRFLDGNQANGRVLTSDALGNASWQVAPGGQLGPVVYRCDRPSGAIDGTCNGQISVSPQCYATFAFSGSGMRDCTRLGEIVIRP
jgi:hypothetical protein